MLGRKRAHKVHIGAIFDHQPVHHKKCRLMAAEEREFVVDIDVDDYTNAGIDKDNLEACDAAWPLVAIGLIIIETILRERFGFKNILKVYSGRRGAHLTVYDARACALTNEVRASMVEYMQPHKSKHTETGRPQYGNIMSAAFFGPLWETHVVPFWVSVCLKPAEEGGLGVLDSVIDREDFVRLLGNAHVERAVNITALSGAAAWNALWKYAQNCKYAESTVKALQHTVLSYVWPRLDANVSKQRNHLSKAFFSLHPKTGRVCVPIVGDPSHFNPAECPMLSEVVERNRDHLRAFCKATTQFSEFVDRLARSASEQWSPPRIQLPTTAVHSLVGQKRLREKDNGDQYFFLDRNRLCFNVARVFAAIASTAEPNYVKMVFYTVLAEHAVHDCVQTIYAGYSPPFRCTSHFPAHAFRKAIRAAAMQPETEVRCDKAYVCILLHPRNCDKAWAEAKLARLRDGLLDETTIGSANAAWDDAAIDGVLNSIVKPVWDVDHVFLG